MSADDIDRRLLPMYDPFGEAPYVEVEQIGRWRYRLTVHHGVFVWGPDGDSSYFIGKREWAEWRASWLLLRYWRYWERVYGERPTWRLG